MGLFEVSLKTKSPSYADMEFLNPSKKIKLDLPNNHDGNIENDDEWGGDDITAEEFDMLETQATQKLAETSSRTFRQPFPVTNGKNKTVSIKEDEMKQQQYELEGKIRILSDSITKLSKELNDEKINRDKLIAQKVSEFKIKENTLHKEIQRLESVLQFKNQEMKSVYDKVHILQMQVKEKKENLEKEQRDVVRKEEKLKEKETDPQSFKFQDNFLNKFQFESRSSIHVTGIQNKNNESAFRKYRLQIDTPKGKTTGSEIVSSILCNRLSIPPAQNSFISPLITNQNPNALARTSVQISPVSIARLNSDKETSELLDYFDNVLENYVTHLNGISDRNAVAGPSTTSPLSLRRKESSQDRSYVISVLKDLSLFLSCHQFVSVVQKLEFTSMDSNENKKVSKQNDLMQAMNTNQTICHTVHSLFRSLVRLSNSNTYPTSFVKIEEIEWSLAALVSWSFSASQNFMQYISEIPLASFISSYHSERSLVLILKLLTNLCTCKRIIPVVTHQNDTCVLCSLASLTLQKINGSTPQFINVMLLVEDFFSTIFTMYNFRELKLDLSPCPSLILQGIVISLWKFCEIHKENTGEFNLIFRKGFTLLHLLSRYFPNFKERRTGFEDNYISLVGRMLTMSKENPLFKDFYDLIHDLWDFQDDTSELDLDEPSEDSVTNMDFLSQTSS
ncbi:uncharacterized protein LOC129988612 [Argiope bruennichi]|uniref:uncharacterized protein LOC129988612 n=1 Tax=Argiope bruennichi TaxID=94029 RepID=UPI0024949929|nr:uncharacterized protein LOC129988612 [Argiope bruennichi]